MPKGTGQIKRKKVKKTIRQADTMEAAFKHILLVKRFMDLYMELIDKVAEEFEITPDEVLDHMDIASEEAAETAKNIVKLRKRS